MRFMVRANEQAKARDIFPRKRQRVRPPGLPDAEERQTKLRLAYALNTILDEPHLAQAGAAARLGLNQPKVSALRNYKLEGFSVERLMALLNALDQDIENRHPRKTALARGGADQRGEAGRIVRLTSRLLAVHGLKARTFFRLAFALNSFFG